jgi:hypothetical protein
MPIDDALKTLEINFDYNRISDSEILLIPNHISEKDLLNTFAQISYDMARPVGAGYFQNFETKTEDIDFSPYINLESKFEVLSMEYINGRQCKTFVSKNNKGELIFDSAMYEIDRGPAELLLDKVKEQINNFYSSNNKPVYWDRVELAAAQINVEIDIKNPRESRLRVALALDAEGRSNEAVEIMTGRDFEIDSVDGSLLLIRSMSNEPAKKFYEGFASIDR